LKPVVIGIIGEFHSESKSQILLNQSLDWLKKSYRFEYEWVGTLAVEKNGERILKNFSGIWSAPGSPFASLEGGIAAVEYARTRNIPHLGTCGGFQHMIIEFARNVLNIKNAQHEEYDSTAPNLFISKLSCSLVGKTMTVKIKENTVAFRSYRKNESVEDYYCSFGINPDFRDKLNHPEFAISGVDRDGEIRIIENPENDFFVGTLFVPQSRATEDSPHPIIETFIRMSMKKGMS
jgi:CTP synthase (UTP-ammonia lyase)